MDKIIKFPVKEVRDRLLIENAIKDLLEKTVAGPKTKKELKKRFLGIWDIYQRDLTIESIPMPIPASIRQEEKEALLDFAAIYAENIAKAFHDHLNVLLQERFLAEIRALGPDCAD
jgi:hypothetical protein